jgi:hypothetical protein
MENKDNMGPWAIWGAGAFSARIVVGGRSENGYHPVCTQISSEVLFMKLPLHLLWLPVIVLFAVLPAHAQENVQSQPPSKYRMELVYVFDAESPEFVFVIGNTGFKSVVSLKKFLGSLPAGSILEWAASCRRIGYEPLLSSEQEIEDFKAFCAEKNIEFVLIPSG